MDTEGAKMGVSYPLHNKVGLPYPMLDIVETTSGRILMILHPITTTRNWLYVSYTLVLEGRNPWVSLSTLSADYTNECNRLSHFHTTDILDGCQPLRLDLCYWYIGPWYMSCEWYGRSSSIFSQRRSMTWADGVSTTSNYSKEMLPIFW